MKSRRKLRPVLQALFVLSVTIVAGCKEDDPVPAEPTLAVSSDQLVDGVFYGVVGGAGEKGELRVQLEVTAPAGIKSLQVMRTWNDEGGEHTEIEQYAVDENVFELSEEIVYSPNRFDISAGTKLTALIVDNRDREVSIELAKVEAFWPLVSKGTTFMDCDKKTDVENDTHYFVVRKTGMDADHSPIIDIQTVGMTAMSGIVSSGAQLIFEYDPGAQLGSTAGAYLCSPNEASKSNPALVEAFTTKNQTFIKAINYAALTAEEQDQLGKMNKDDVALLLRLFDKYQPGSTSEKLPLKDIPEGTAFILFKTQGGKIGMLRNHQLEDTGSTVILQFGIWMMR